MATLEPYMEAIVLAANVLTLTPPADRALIVTDIQVDGVAAGNDITVIVERTTVGFFEVGGARNQLGGLNELGNNVSVPAYMRMLGIPWEYPVQQGETFRLELPAAVTGDIKVVYREVEPGDATPDMENSSAGRQLLYLAHGTNTAAGTGVGDITIDLLRNPGEFIDFPFAGDLPDNTVAELLGYLFAEVTDTDVAGPPANGLATERMTVLLNRKRMWTHDAQGFLVRGDLAVTGSGVITYFGGNSQIPYHAEDRTKPLWLFPEPIALVGGDEMTHTVSLVANNNGAGVSFAAQTARLAAILRTRSA